MSTRVSHRVDRVAEGIQRALAESIQSSLRDPRIQKVTLSSVQLSPDLKNAKIYFSVLPEENAQQALEALQKASGFLRGELARGMTLKTVPTLSFVYDDSWAHAHRVHRLIDAALSGALAKEFPER